MVFVVALTGGIASGKTTVSDRFAELGVPVIDADIIARKLSEPGTRPFNEIIAAFGRTILTADGRIDRRLLRSVIFQDSRKRKLLDSILHPAIYQELERNIAELHSGYCLVVIPLLAETGVPDWVDWVLVVDVDEATQLDRLSQRDNLTTKQASRVLNVQASRSERRRIANDVIVNSGSIEDLYNDIQKLHKKYTTLSADIQ